MKKGLVLGLIGLSSLFTLVGGVKAETLDLTNVSTTGQTVTVGEVDAPVYSVDITWGDLTYDYKYNQVTSEYYWQSKKVCEKLYLDQYGEMEHSYNNKELDIYWDDACENEMEYGIYNDFNEALSHVYFTSDDPNGAGTIQILDNSVNAKIKPSVSWASESDYDFVNGKFEYEGTIVTYCDPITTEEEMNMYVSSGNKIYNDSSCSMENLEENRTFYVGKYYIAAAGGRGFKELIGTKLPEDARSEGAGNGSTIGWYFLRLSLENNPAKEAKMPVKGDKIGTVTINIDAA